ncbi:MAG: alanine racemase, partial [Planctomycetota bacterium]
NARGNIRRVIEAMGGDPARWRPHVKTVKMPSVFREMARQGLRCFKCATTREMDRLLAALADEGVDDPDVLLAHPLAGPGLGRLAELSARHPRARLSLLREDPESVGEVPDGVGVFIDVNPGMNRTGAPLDELERIEATARRAGDRLRGIHFYDGHLGGLDRTERRQRAFAGYDRLVALIGSLRSCGIDPDEIITSGTPSFLEALQHPGLGSFGHRHRVSPGTVTFHDTRSVAEVPELGLQPAALLLARVVSRPAPDIATCDAGSKSIAAEAGDPCAEVVGHPGLLPLRPTEEHLPLRVIKGAAPSRGTPLLLVPRHVCPTVNLAEQALVVDGDEVRIEAVSARAHEI